MTKKHRKLIAIVGPTASGKTAVGVKLAKKFNGEIVSADSRQIYRSLDIGTAKEGVPNQEWTTNKTNHEKTVDQQLNNETIEQLRRSLRWIDDIPQWMIDICEPEEEFNLFKYLNFARAAIEDIYSRGKVPIIVGGTGLYVQALIEGFQLKQSQNSNLKSQNSSERSTLGLYSREQLNNSTVEQLNDILQKIDPEAFERVDQKNPHRLIRAIERAQEGTVVTKEEPDWEALQIGIDWPREELNKRIDKRVDDRFQQGMLEETENLLKAGVDPSWLFGLGLEYKIMTSFLISNDKFQISNKTHNSKIKKLIQNSKFEIKSYDEMVDALKNKSHQYAKRQMTWFKRFPEIVWEKEQKKIEKIVAGFLAK